MRNSSDLSELLQLPDTVISRCRERREGMEKQLEKSRAQGGTVWKNQKQLRSGYTTGSCAAAAAKAAAYMLLSDQVVTQVSLLTDLLCRSEGQRGRSGYYGWNLCLCRGQKNGGQLPCSGWRRGSRQSYEKRTPAGDRRGRYQPGPQEDDSGGG